MTRISFEAMSLDDLWNLHERVVSILEKRLDHERQKREHQLKELGRKFGGAPSATRERRPYPKVPQKFCNPADPAQTWSGRGKQPRWVKTLMASGASLADVRIDTAKLIRDWLERAGR
jgi:DNA-binding protein H-NS